MHFDRFLPDKAEIWYILRISRRCHRYPGLLKGHCLTTHLSELSAGTLLDGVIVRNYGLYFDVATPVGQVRATLRGILKRERVKTNPATVGDRVQLTLTTPGSSPPEGVIEQIIPRIRSLSRLARGTDDVEQVILANPDQLIAVFSIQDPEPHPRMIDRFLLIAEAQNLDAAIVINKLDLASDRAASQLANRFKHTGYPVFKTSAVTDEGIDDLREHLTNKISAFAGPSGVGKSSLLNRIVPELNEPTGDISEATGKGRHTTTWTTLFEIGPNTFVADTPGMRQLGLWGVDFERLDELFPEFQPFLGRCRFGDCRHINEPSCAVLAGVESGKIDQDRYMSYRQLLVGDADGDQSIQHSPPP